MASKVYHTAIHVCHWTHNGVAGAAVSDRFALDYIFKRCKKQAEKVGTGEGFWGGGGGIVGALAHKELDASESEGVLIGICTALAVLSGVQEEEE